MKQTSLQILFVVILSLFEQGCALGLGKSLHQFSYSDNPVPLSRIKGKTRTVEAEGVANVIIATTSTEQADRAFRNLLSKCPKGEIINIRVKHTTSLGILAYDDKVQMTGICVEGT